MTVGNYGDLHAHTRSAQSRLSLRAITKIKTRYKNWRSNLRSLAIKIILNMKQHNYFVYIMTNKNDTVLYTGVTNNLVRRVWEHKNKFNSNSFTARYNINKLVYCENFQYIQDAIAEEKRIKAGSRTKKETLIRKQNSNWDDLANDWVYA
jgi:putative endonuclease